MTDVSFDAQALEVSKQYNLALDDVKDTYAAKPEKLSTMFNQMATARHSRNVAVGLTVVAGLAFLPLAVWPGYHVYKNQTTLDWVGKEVRGEVAKAQTSPSAPPPVVK
jgi:hypothetical protein